MASRRRAAPNSGSEVGHPRRHLGAQQLDAAQQVSMRQPRIGHLQRDPIDTAELIGYPPQLLDDGVGITEEKGAVGAAGGIELCRGWASGTRAPWRPG